MNQHQATTKKYVIIFSLYYFVLLVAANILKHGFAIDLGTGANIAMLFGAGYTASIKFVTDLKRAPSQPEKRYLSLVCLLCWFLISACVVLITTLLVHGTAALTEFGDLFKQLPILVWLAILAVIGISYFFILNLLFGWVAKKYATKITAT